MINFGSFNINSARWHAALLSIIDNKSATWADPQTVSGRDKFPSGLGAVSYEIGSTETGVVSDRSLVTLAAAADKSDLDALVAGPRCLTWLGDSAEVRRSLYVIDPLGRQFFELGVALSEYGDPLLLSGGTPDNAKFGLFWPTWDPLGSAGMHDGAQRSSGLRDDIRRLFTAVLPELADNRPIGYPLIEAIACFAACELGQSTSRRLGDNWSERWLGAPVTLGPLLHACCIALKIVDARVGVVPVDNEALCGFVGSMMCRNFYLDNMEHSSLWIGIRLTDSATRKSALKLLQRLLFSGESQAILRPINERARSSFVTAGSEIEVDLETLALVHFPPFLPEFAEGIEPEKPRDGRSSGAGELIRTPEQAKVYGLPTKCLEKLEPFLALYANGFFFVTQEGFDHPWMKLYVGLLVKAFKVRGVDLDVKTVTSEQLAAMKEVRPPSGLTGRRPDLKFAQFRGRWDRSAIGQDGQLGSFKPLACFHDLVSGVGFAELLEGFLSAYPSNPYRAVESYYRLVDLLDDVKITRAAGASINESELINLELDLEQRRRKLICGPSGEPIGPFEVDIIVRPSSTVEAVSVAPLLGSKSRSRMTALTTSIKVLEYLKEDVSLSRLARMVIIRGQYGDFGAHAARAMGVELPFEQPSVDGDQWAAFFSKKISRAPVAVSLKPIKQDLRYMELVEASTPHSGMAAPLPPWMLARRRFELCASPAVIGDGERELSIADFWSLSHDQRDSVLLLKPAAAALQEIRRMALLQVNQVLG